MRKKILPGEICLCKGNYFQKVCIHPFSPTFPPHLVFLDLSSLLSSPPQPPPLPSSQMLTNSAFTTALSAYLSAFSYSSTTEDDLFLYLEVWSLLFLLHSPPGSLPGSRFLAPGRRSTWLPGGDSQDLDSAGWLASSHCQVGQTETRNKIERLMRSTKKSITKFSRYNFTLNMFIIQINGKIFFIFLFNNS